MLGHGHNGLLVHVGVVYAHATENGKGFNEIFIVFGEDLFGDRIEKGESERKLGELVKALGNPKDLMKNRLRGLPNYQIC